MLSVTAHSKVPALSHPTEPLELYLVPAAVAGTLAHFNSQQAFAL